VPACMQMILQRRGFKFSSQAEIGYDLGLVVPRPYRKLFPKSQKVKRPEFGWGTRMNLAEYSLAFFFKKGKYPLKKQHYSAESFLTPKEFCDFIRKNIQEQNDMLISYNYPALWNEWNKRHNGESYGHVSLIADINYNLIELVDPEEKKNVTVHAKDLLEVMQADYNGIMWCSIWVVKDENKK